MHISNAGLATPNPGITPFNRLGFGLFSQKNSGAGNAFGSNRS